MFCHVEVKTPPKSSDGNIPPLQLPNALAACVLSTHLPAMQRQWATQQLVKCLSTKEQNNLANLNGIIFADLTSSMPACGITKLEGHQNRVIIGIWNDKKKLLATWFVYHSILPSRN